MRNYDGVFNANLNQITARLNNPITPFEKTLPGLFEQMAMAELFEQFLLFDKVCIELSIFNISRSLALIVHTMGLEQFLDCVREGSIEFCLLGTLTTGLGPNGSGQWDETLLYGRPPVVGGYMEPEQVKQQILNCFKLFRNSYSRREKEQFVQTISQLMRVQEEDRFSKKAIQLVIDAYTSNALRTMGLPYDRHPNSLNHQARVKLQQLSGDIEIAQFLATHNYTAYSCIDPVHPHTQFDILKNALDRIQDGIAIAKSSDILLKLEKLPHLARIYTSGSLNFYDAIQLRKLSMSRDFRHWLNTSANAQDCEKISFEYLRAIERSTGKFQTGTGKWVKDVFFFAVGLVLSGAVDGVLGIGSPVGQLIGGSIAASGLKNAADFVSNQFLASVADSVNKGFRPSMFLLELRSQIQFYERDVAG